MKHIIISRVGCLILAISLLSFKHIDKSSQITESWLLQMDNGEEIKITWALTGCFSFQADSILIKKEYYQYSLVHNGHRRKLNANDIQYLVYFEKQLDAYAKKEATCTSVEQFTFLYKDQERKYTDATCNFLGASKLAKYLKLTK